LNYNTGGLICQDTPFQTISIPHSQETIKLLIGKSLF